VLRTRIDERRRRWSVVDSGVVGTRRYPDDGPEVFVTDEGVRWLVNLPALTALDLSGQDVTDRAVETLAGCSTECGGCPALTSLDIQSCQKLTNTAMWALRNLTTLTSLDVTLTGIDDVGMLSLSTLPALTDLHIGFTDVTDEGLRALANLPALTSLNIEECEFITDEGLAALPARVGVSPAYFGP
jgi:internalin A